jgi:serine/threonine-protein kinase
VAFNTAVRLDPDYAAAWARLSTAEDNVASISGSSAAQTQVLTQAREHAEKAVALAPDLALAHNNLGNILFDELNWSGAEAQFRRAAQLAPAYASAKANLASIIATLGRPEEAVPLLQQALKLDPLRSLSYSYLAETLMALGRLDEAETAIRNAIALQPDGNDFYGRLSQIDILRGNSKAALADAQREPTGPFHDIAVTLALQIGINRAAADAALKSLIANSSDDSPYQIAQSYALRKDADNMFKWLEHARTAKDGGLQYLLSDPFILPYRHDPRFAKLREELKLPPPKN